MSDRDSAASDRESAASDRGTAVVEARDFTVLDRTVHFDGPVFRLVSDDVSMPGGERARRDYLQHVGAVGIVAIDDDGRIVLVRQYRHPVGAFLWELPAGLIDVAGESLVKAAARELAEEADLVAADWQLLTDIHPTPGSSNEVIRLFVARGLREVPDIDRYQREHEEATMTVERVPLDEAVGMVLAGRITNAAAAVGVLAAERLRDAGWPVLRAIDEPLAPRRSGDLP